MPELLSLAKLRVRFMGALYATFDALPTAILFPTSVF